MRHRAALVVAAVACGGALSACGSGTAAPERAADAVGAAASIDSDAGGVRVHFAHDDGYEYFEGTIFVLDDDVTVVGAAAASDIAAGDRLRVWTTACAESFPVQCEVEAIEVLD